jgi:Flp pilus assembly protein TadD
MNRGVKAALLISGLSLAGCTSSAKQVEVRAIPDRSAILSQGGDSVAVARGQFALGDVGLALEGFRKAQRENPADPRALAGIGDCYAAMGRFDIAQSSYEAALALAPNDRKLLLGLAAIFEREGQMLRAAEARADADRALRAAQQPPAIAAAAPVVPQTAPAIPAALAAVRQAVPAIAAAASAIPQIVPAIAAATSPVRQAAAAPAEQAIAMRGSITVELPPARPVNHVIASAEVQPLPDFVDEPRSSSVTVALPPAVPAPVVRSVKAEPRMASANVAGPRLERLSPGEVALVTTGKPIWQAQGATRMASLGNVRWVALAQNGTRPNVQVLNAAQAQGIAASARSVLLNRGWRRIAVGNAPATQEKSVVLYPRSRARLGRSLAAQFGVGARMVERDILVLVLGRDAVDRIAGQRKS